MYICRNRYGHFRKRSCIQKRPSIKDHSSCDLHFLQLSFMSLQHKGCYLTSILFPLSDWNHGKSHWNRFRHTAYASFRNDTCSHVQQHSAVITWHAPKKVPYFFAVCYTVTFKHFGSIAGLHFAVEPCQTFSQVRATTRFLQGLTEALSQLVAEHMAQADEGANTTFPHLDALT